MSKDLILNVYWSEDKKTVTLTAEDWQKIVDFIKEHRELTQKYVYPSSDGVRIAE